MLSLSCSERAARHQTLVCVQSGLGAIRKAAFALNAFVKAAPPSKPLASKVKLVTQDVFKMNQGVRAFQAAAQPAQQSQAAADEDSDSQMSEPVRGKQAAQNVLKPTLGTRSLKGAGEGRLRRNAEAEDSSVGLRRPAKATRATWNVFNLTQGLSPVWRSGQVRRQSYAEADCGRDGHASEDDFSGTAANQSRLTTARSSVSTNSLVLDLELDD